MRENCIEWLTGDKIATLTFSQPKFINRVLKLAEIDPDAFEIIEKPETNGGYLVAHVQVSGVKIARKPKISDEVRNRLADNLKSKTGQ